MKKLIVLLVLLILSGCGMELKPTPERAYLEDTKKLKAIKEHQKLQLEIMHINVAIAQLQAEAKKNAPSFNLTPKKEE